VRVCYEEVLCHLASQRPLITQCIMWIW